MERTKDYTNRDGAHIWLEQIEGNLWKLNSDKEYVLKYMRVIYDENKEIVAVDPSGGPFINLGCEFTTQNEETIKIKSIKGCTIFEME